MPAPGGRPAAREHLLVADAPDDAVLFGLDGCDDVAHPVTARRVDRREQGCVAAVVASAPSGRPSTSSVKSTTSTPAGVELAAPAHVLRAGGGGHVERARCRRPPIEQQRFVLVLLVEQADAADVGAVRPTGRPTDRNTARCPPRPAASPLWPAHAPRHPGPRVSRHSGRRWGPATPRCTDPSLARARRRAACRARSRSSARTAIRASSISS